MSAEQLLLNASYHVFLPPKLPQKAPDEATQHRINHRLTTLVLEAANAYRENCSVSSLQWMRISIMLSRLALNLINSFDKPTIEKHMTDMRPNDIVALHIREQNAAVIIRKSHAATTFEIFEAQAPNAAVMSTPGKLVRHFPGPAIEVPNSTAEDPGFISEIANFLAQMGVEVLDGATAKATKAGSQVTEVRDAADPHYISQLFTGILRGFGHEVEPRRVVKRIADEVLWDSAHLPWRRSPIWLIIRVSLQTTLEDLEYKHFMVYVHAYILGLAARDPSFSSDLLVAMRIKMACRMLKVQDSLPKAVVSASKDASDLAETLLQRRWATVQAQTPRFEPLDLEPKNGIVQTLPNSRAYLVGVLQGRAKRNKLPPFKPNCIPRLLDNYDFSVFANGALTRAFEQTRFVALFDFEKAVHHHLLAWASDNSYYPADSCAILSSCFDQYTKAALSYYKTDAADTSIMILTIMVLWVTVDYLITKQHGLLLDYSPEVPEDILESLLLHSSLHLEQARMVQMYLHHRHNDAKFGSSFDLNNTDTSFAVRFFRQSGALQDLKHTIEHDAQVQQGKKLQELQRLNAEHARLRQQAASMECTYNPTPQGNPKHKQKKCRKCQIQKQSNSMKIAVYEWPLPAKTLDAEAAVFELQCPEEVHIWRAMTQQIVGDLGGAASQGKASHHETLEKYDGLKKWARPSKHRMSFASSTKSFRKSHYSNIKIPSTANAVCVNNGLNFRLFDSNLSNWASSLTNNAKFSGYGTLQLPQSSPYRYLQYSLEGTTHTSNQVIANQSDCPKNISLHEHYAFGTLRSGPRLQWMNIIRGLEENILTFNREEVYLLHTQAAWQLGSLSNGGESREWHLEIENPEFGRLLVHEATQVLDRVQANWLEGTTVHTIVMLVARLLASTTDSATQQAAYKFLHNARSVTFGWLEELSRKLRDAQAQAQDFEQRLCEIALICRATYDIDESRVSELLTTPADWVPLVISSIILYDNKPPKPENSPQHLQMLLGRDSRLAMKIHPVLISTLQRSPRILDLAISRYWSGYYPGRYGWTAPLGPAAEWVTTHTAIDETGSSRQVHFNVIEGRLLIDGQPFGRLPPEYVSHPTYFRLFGQKALDVVPINSSGMFFATRTLVYGHQIAFSLSSTKQLTIQASIGEETFELIPHKNLAEDFPTFFSSDYHHWMNLKTGVVEFRPLNEPWVSSHDSWRLQFSNRSSSVMTRMTAEGSVFLVDRHSTTFQKIASQISPLESPAYLHVTQSGSSTPTITADLPRMKISFFVNEAAHLESRNFSGKVIDLTQSSRTLFGLKDQLLLCAKDPVARSLPQSRKVLIPYGAVQFSQQADHVKVHIDRGSERYVSFYQYQVDDDLGCLVNSNASLTSRLFKIYLHALTSHCLPDPLTGRTGTEEALHELAEAATTSFDQIDPEQARLLQLIGTLTPKRVYYPTHLKAMQRTTWANLPSLSQHYSFCSVTNSVLERARSLKLFNPLSFDLEPHRVQYDENLLKRAAYRTRIYYPTDSTNGLAVIVNSSNRADDSGYEGKDHNSRGWAEGAQQAAWATDFVNTNWEKPFHVSCNLVSQFERWGDVQGPTIELQVTYSQEWLDLKLPCSWLSIYNACRTAASPSARYGLGVCLAAGAYSGWLTQDLIPALVSFAINPLFQPLKSPSHPSYHLSDRYDPSLSRITALVTSNRRAIEGTPSHNIPKEKNESKATYKQRRKTHYNSTISSLEPQLVNHLISYWPNTPDSMPSTIYSSWFNVNNCLSQVRTYFTSCSRNLDIRDHLHLVEKALASVSTLSNTTYSNRSRALAKPNARTSHLLHNEKSLSFDQLTKTRIQNTRLDVASAHPSVPLSSTPTNAPETKRLESLLTELRKNSVHPLHRRYASDLEVSRVDLAQRSTQSSLNALPVLSLLEQNRALFHRHLGRCFEVIVRWLGPTTEVEEVVAASGIWPRLTPRMILGRLTLQARANISQTHQEEFVKYARAYIEYQRSQRLLGFALDGKQDEFYSELVLDNAESEAEANHPDWLLVQIDGNFSARRVQTEVAREMITPSSSANTVLQLNMGEGKSSVIVPIVAAALADTTRLVRVVVLKPLWRQMFYLLVNRLSGLVNRRIYYLPFGRHIRVGESQASQIQAIYTECMREGGILLVQPEHILSFKLMGVDRLLSASNAKEVAASKNLQDTEKWLRNNARDILDESDEILHVRYQLVYTVGEQQSLDGHPDRWTITQQVLSLVAGHICRLKQEYPDNLKFEARGQGQFPFVRIMPDSDEVIAKIIQAVAADAVAGLIPNLNFGILPRTIRNMGLRLITSRQVTSGDAKLLNKLDPSMRGGLLLLRGLLAHGIVAFVLRDKHYRVDYGLHFSRCLLAVPYHAKDIPSPRAEFGHPEVAIVLTCLSYYYGGLTESQLEICFELLFKLDNPDLEYDQWVRRSGAIPQGLQMLKSVNLKDREQFTHQLVPTFSQNAAVVDFFLSLVVFPKEAKQFPHKLSASGWDLAEIKTQVTTGFSGTNDNRYLLPSSIVQSDPVKQSSTNALVLTYLLQPENNHYLCIRGANGETCSAKEFLDMLVTQDPEIRVLLDVGAQMLELTNDELVKHWLILRPDVSAAVYFDDNDELVILPQNGSPTPFHSSPFSQQMERCIVYLDDGHTRGTDLKLPKGTRAAVTLGPKVTKDRLLQGCMRMRKLGFGQSVMFCAPTEIDKQIRKAAKINIEDRVDALDVLRWAMLETCKDLEHHSAHWVQQGVEHHRRAQALNTFASTASTKSLQSGWLTPEARSLEEMYGVHAGDIEFITKAFGIPSLKRHLEELGIRNLQDPGRDEEQEREREVSHEVERQRQVERPAKFYAASHSVHQDIRRFIKTGAVPQLWSGVVSLFQPLKASGALQSNAWSSRLLASLDFCKTLTSTNVMHVSDYMRPVNWVLSGPNGNLLVLSPYEVDQLLPNIRRSPHVRLHIFSPRTAHSMESFCKLQFYSPPSFSKTSTSPPDLLLQLQLSLFAGQLYFEDYTQYQALCGFLGVYIGTDAARDADDIEVQSDGFVPESDRQKLVPYIPDYAACRFRSSPIAALKDLVGYRRKGMEFLRTHIGQILHARRLTPNDF